MAISFKYKAVRRPDQTTIKTPSVPVIFHGKQVFETIALIDSGADISVISKDVAELLGLDLNKDIHFAFGIGGKVEAIETTVPITVEKGHERYTFSLPIKVILGKYDFPILLGRQGFLINLLFHFINTKNASY